VTDTTLGDWRLIDVNLMGVVHGLHAFLPRLLAQDRPAHIVNTASMAGVVPAAGLGRMVDLYAQRGTSPDVVVRQALAAVTHGRRVVPTPRYQVVPHWLLKRAFPRQAAPCRRRPTGT
jgi:NAD(P)-dependent dehydrogenase (short-subunit alcohol dehydrogenase family)